MSNRPIEAFDPLIKKIILKFGHGTSMYGVVSVVLSVYMFYS